MHLEVKSQLHQQAKEHLLESAALKMRMVDLCLDDTILAGKLIADSLRVGGKLLLCGNGGSAADCQHLAGEFVNCLNKDFQRPGLAAIALTTDTSFLTAYANDCNFEGIFSRQVETLGRSEDVLLGISTSGNSANVIEAMKAAKKIGISTIALTGSGGVIAEIADIAIAVPSTNTQHIQEGHLAIEHILCRLVEQHLFENA